MSRLALALKTCSALFVLLLAALLGVGPVLAGPKTLMITPIQIVFADRQRNVDVYVYNPTQEEITYKIDTVTLREDAKGQMREIAPGQESAEEQKVRGMVRFAPRRATIAAGGRQVLKFMVNKPADLAPGEYRTRVILRPLPAAAKAEAAPRPAGDQGVKMEVQLLVNSSFPITIQHGVSGEVEPVGVRLVSEPGADSGLAAEVSLKRSGGGSAFGSLRLAYVPTNDPGASREVGHQEWVTLRLPATEKTMRVALKNISRQELAAGMLRVTFRPGLTASQRSALGKPVSRDFPVR